MVGSAVFLSYFTYRRLRDFQKNKESLTNRFFLYAAFFVSIALYVYGLSAFAYSYIPALLPIGAVVATILNMIGFAFFFCIPLNAWFSPRLYVFLTHAVSIFVIIIAMALIISPPASRLLLGGVVAWGFTPLQSCLILFLNAVAFSSNIFVLYKNFRESLDRTWFLRVVAIILTFVLTGLGGGYLYFGSNAVLLQYAYVLLFVGIVSQFVGSLGRGSK